jgi:hypothetical protein
MLNAIQKSRSKRNVRYCSKATIAMGNMILKEFETLRSLHSDQSLRGPKHSVQIGKKSWGQKKNIQLSNSILKIKELHKAARDVPTGSLLCSSVAGLHCRRGSLSAPRGAEENCGGPATVGLLNSRSIGQNMSDPQALANFTHTQLALVW